MQTISETRLQRLTMLVDQHGGKLADLNTALGLDRTDPTLSQIRSKVKHSKTGKPRVMGDELARRIEATLNLQNGWMDTPPTYAEMYGEHDINSMVLKVMENMKPYEKRAALRLVTALAERDEPNGTTG